MSWWKRLKEVFRLRLQKTPPKRLQDMLIKMNIFALVICLQNTSWRRLQDILLKTDIFVKRRQDVFKTEKCLEGIFKTSWRRPHDHAYGYGTKFPRMNSLDIPKLLKQFFKTLYEDIIVKIRCQKRCCSLSK